MSARPKTVRDAIAYLYKSLAIAARPRSWDAGALETIETETERVEAENAALRRYALALEETVIGCTSDDVIYNDVDGMRAEAGVLDLMDDAPGDTEGE